MADQDLIEAAMAGVEVVTCPRCNGERFIGLTTLRIACPVCSGAGLTTTNELEVSPMADTPTGRPTKPYIASQADREVAVKALKAYTGSDEFRARNMASMICYGTNRVVFPTADEEEADG